MVASSAIVRIEVCPAAVCIEKKNAVAEFFQFDLPSGTTRVVCTP